jgi:polysaccharide pyruvyl transferase WcaK-like protein
MTTDDPPVFYLCGAGGKGNLGAEAIMLAIMRICLRRWPDCTFIVATWYQDRMRKVLDEAGIHYQAIVPESVLSSFSTAGNASVWMICGDVALTESVVPVLPLYYGLRAFALRWKVPRGILFGIESEKLAHPWNRFAVKQFLDRRDLHVIPRNPNSLSAIPMAKAGVSLGTDPTLLLRPEDYSGYEAAGADLPDDKPLVGFAVRDVFNQPLRLTWRGKLARTDVPLGELSDTM